MLRISEPDEHKPFTHKKSLGQNFLTSSVVPQWLVTASDLLPGETVLEIGPGTGMLTRELLVKGVTVVALEADRRAVTILQNDFKEAIAARQLKILHYDVRDLNLVDLGLKDQQYSVVSNIPYYLSGFLLRKLLETPIQPRTLVFLMQKEVVQRIVRDKKSSLLSLSVAAFGDPTYYKSVSRGHFNPPPKVDSAILVIRSINHTRLNGLPPALFFQLLHTGLRNKRKQLVGNLSHHYKREEVLAVFDSLNLPLDRRGEDLSLADWVKLGQALRELQSF